MLFFGRTRFIGRRQTRCPELAFLIGRKSLQHPFLRCPFIIQLAITGTKVCAIR